MSDVERQGSVMWGRVDEGKEAARLADFLSRAAAMGSAQAYKQHAYAALQVAQGARVLDVGCGVGGDVRAIAELVGKTGRVVGLDFAETFLAEARRQSVDYPTVEEARLAGAIGAGGTARWASLIATTDTNPSGPPGQHRGVRLRSVRRSPMHTVSRPS